MYIYIYVYICNVYIYIYISVKIWLMSVSIASSFLYLLSHLIPSPSALFEASAVERYCRETRV